MSDTEQGHTPTPEELEEFWREDKRTIDAAPMLPQPTDWTSRLVSEVYQGMLFREPTEGEMVMGQAVARRAFAFRI